MTNDDRCAADDLLAALPHANIPTLLMVLTHLTGSLKWISEPYRCTMIRGLDDHDSGGLPEALQAEVREAAKAAIARWHSGEAPALPAPSPELLVRMLEASVGEPIPATYGPMIAASLGLDPAFALDQRAEFRVPEGFHVAVIGAGIAGLCMAIRLNGAGIPFTLIEKNSDVGGTWFENRYPGAGVDTPNHIYSYSFAKHDWSRFFALRDEIQAYVEEVTDRFDLRSSIRFERTVEEARYDEARRIWTVRTRDAEGGAEDIRANVLISAVGILNVPKMPDIPGLSDFAGPCFHTARWPQGLDVTGQRVGVIGNGASAMQVVPAIADQVKTMTIFQRSKQWAAPFDKFQKPVPGPVRLLLRDVPFYQEWYRQRLAWIFNDRIHSTLQIDPEWHAPDTAINATNDRHRAYFTRYIEQELGDRQDLLSAVLPDYPPFGKRMLMDNGWYRTVARDKVRLVTGGIARVVADGVVIDTGETVPLEVLVVATGFDAINMLSSYALYGRGGRSIRDTWAAEGAQAFMGVAAPGFPNLFMLTGPNTALGHGGSVVTLIETQTRYVLGLIGQALDRHGADFDIEVRRDRHDAFNAKVQAAHAAMIWSHKGMSNWYRNAQGRVVAPTPFRNDDYWAMVRGTDLSDFNLTGTECSAADQAA